MTAVTYELPAGTLAFDGATTHVMAVINVSPESKNRDTFSPDPATTLERARRHRDLGATIIDLGAQSSHFDNPELDANDEIERLLPHLEALVGDGHLVSVDTWKPAVVRAAIDRGASIINDTGGSRPELVSEVAGEAVGLVAMYLEGENPLAVGEIGFSAEKAAETSERLAAQLDRLRAAGVTMPISDPGIGISYHSDYDEYTRQQLRVVRGLPLLRALGPPVLVPVPRKAEFERVAAFMTLSLEYGADIMRVHDVEAACGLVRLFGRQAR